MSLKKIAPLILIFTSLFLNNCKENKNETMDIKKVLTKSSDSLEKKTSSNFPKIPLKTIRNNEYLLENIKNKPYLQDKEYIKKKINEFFKSSKHIYVKRDTNEIPIYTIQELSLGQLQRIYLVYDYLKDSSSLQEIGKIIENDVLDMYAEHGGIIIFNQKKICFKTLESSVIRDTSNNDLYGIPDEVDSIPNIGLFHLHATSHNEEEHANPSSRDIIISYFATDINNESHDFLITPIREGSFNVDYYGGHKEINPVTKVFDLGSYTYSTSKRFK